MAALDWIKIKDIEFKPEEARVASDFEEVLLNFAIDPDAAYAMFEKSPDELGIGQQMFFAARCSRDALAVLMFATKDDRIAKVASTRLKEEPNEDPR